MKAKPTYKFDPDWVVGPGPILAEWLSDMGLSPRVAMAAIFSKEQREEAAERVQRVLDGAVLTEEVADWLAHLPGAPSKKFWMALEHNYRVGIAAGKHDMSNESGFDDKTN